MESFFSHKKLLHKSNQGRTTFSTKLGFSFSVFCCLFPLGQPVWLQHQRGKRNKRKRDVVIPTLIELSYVIINNKYLSGKFLEIVWFFYLLFFLEICCFRRLYKNIEIFCVLWLMQRKQVIPMLTKRTNTAGCTNYKGSERQRNVPFVCSYTSTKSKD